MIVILCLQFVCLFRFRASAHPLHQQFNKEDEADNYHSNDLPSIEDGGKDREVTNELVDWVKELQWLQFRCLLVLKSFESKRLRHDNRDRQSNDADPLESSKVAPS